MAKLRFGPAGKPLDFKGPMERVPAYLREIGLDALEYEAVRGVRISEKKARLLGEEAEKNGVVMSMHAPYYINLASMDDGTWERSIKRIIDSMKAAEWMGAYAVVIHSGFYKGHDDKKKALHRVIEGYKRAEELLPSWVKKPDFSPEIMGKVSQVGDVDEAIEICRHLRRCRPTVDWAHLYARYEGKMITSVDHVIQVIEKIERELGKKAVDPLHTHFSRIEYGKGGERMHHTLAEKEYGPEWEIVCKAYKEVGLSSVVISESPILDRDALVMKRICSES